jgi:opacity protein-like surface antigen
LPGFKITDNTKIYIDLGYNLMDQTLDVADANNTSGYTTYTKEMNNQGGFQYGGGIETMIYSNIGIRLAYTVQQNSEVKFESENSTRYYASTPTVYNFFFGATYHFKW